MDAILLTISDAAKYIGRGTTFIYEALGDGRLQAVKSDTRTLVVAESLRQYAATLPAAKIDYLPKRRKRA
jgi:excisionase family DNA binding protein